MAKEDKYADEILSDEELDNVVGGTTNEELNDASFFNALAKQGFKIRGTLFNNIGQQNLREVFASYGVEFSAGVFTNNNGYSIDGQKYPRSVSLGWVLGTMGYPGYDGNRIFDIAYTDNFIRSHLGSGIV